MSSAIHAVSAARGSAEHSRTSALQALVRNIERVVTGKRAVVELAAITVAAGGHLLLEDVAGVGKTVLARALARSISGSFARVQGAPDLLPADVTGASVYAQSSETFRFVAGPVFANVLLVDELNRATSRTQAALLEAMEERQVTVDGTAHPLPAPHFVVATQNPVEQHGTFPLPESQLDRFAVATSVGYPGAADEAAIVRAQAHHHPLDDLDAVLSSDDVLRLQREVREIGVSDELISYAVRLVSATRSHPRILLGASPRATIQLVRLAQARAALHGRGFALPDDVKALAPVALGHRLAAETDAAGRAGEGRDVVRELLDSVPVG